MGKIIDTEKLRDCLLRLNKFMEKEKLNKFESILVIEQYLDSLKMLEKLDNSKALRKTLEEHGEIDKP